MVHMTKLHVALLIVIFTVELIDASCLSYGHSCWGAHGKRSFVPQRERDQKTKTAEPNDRWGLFNIVPEKNDLYRLKGSFQGQQQIPYPENAINSLNFPLFEQQASSEETNPITNNIERTSQDLPQEFSQKQTALRQRIPLIDNLKAFQVLRLNKPNMER